MKLLWDERAWDDYCYWQMQDIDEISHSKEVNPLEDDEVDRAEVEVWQHMELTVTNRVRA